MSTHHAQAGQHPSSRTTNYSGRADDGGDTFEGELHVIHHHAGRSSGSVLTRPRYFQAKFARSLIEVDLAMHPRIPLWTAARVPPGGVLAACTNAVAIAIRVAVILRGRDGDQRVLLERTVEEGLHIFRTTDMGF